MMFFHCFSMCTILPALCPVVLWRETGARVRFWLFRFFFFFLFASPCARFHVHALLDFLIFASFLCFILGFLLVPPLLLRVWIFLVPTSPSLYWGSPHVQCSAAARRSISSGCAAAVRGALAPSPSSPPPPQAAARRAWAWQARLAGLRGSTSLWHLTLQVQRECCGWKRNTQRINRTASRTSGAAFDLALWLRS